LAVLTDTTAVAIARAVLLRAIQTPAAGSAHTALLSVAALTGQTVAAVRAYRRTTVITTVAKLANALPANAVAMAGTGAVAGTLALLVAEFASEILLTDAFTFGPIIRTVLAGVLADGLKIQRTGGEDVVALMVSTSTEYVQFSAVRAQRTRGELASFGSSAIRKRQRHLDPRRRGYVKQKYVIVHHALRRVDTTVN